MKIRGSARYIARRIRRLTINFLQSVEIDLNKQLIVWNPNKLELNIFEILGILRNSGVLDIADYCCWPRKVSDNKYAVVYRRRRKKNKTIVGTKKDLEDLHMLIDYIRNLDKTDVRKYKVVLESMSRSYVLGYKEWLVGYVVENQAEVVMNSELLKEIKSTILTDTVR